jgi:hypothetical protein
MFSNLLAPYFSVLSHVQIFVLFSVLQFHIHAHKAAGKPTVLHVFTFLDRERKYKTSQLNGS